MTVFTLHLRVDDGSIDDFEGLVFTSQATARKAAIEGARDLIAGDVKSGRFDINQRFELCDAAGVICQTIPFCEVVKVIPSSNGSGFAAASMCNERIDDARADH